MENNILCPVCQKPLEQTGNPQIYFCPVTKIYFPYLNVNLDMSHANIYLNETGGIKYLKIISGGYLFDIFGITDLTRAPEYPQTVIKKLQKIKETNLDFITHVGKEFHFVDMITINSILNLPWHNHDKVQKTVKTYLLFS